MSKSFFNMTSKERDAEAKKLEREISFGETRPLSAKGKILWKLAKRGRGRPKKPVGQKSQRILISIEPGLLSEIEKYSKENGLDRSKLFALSAKAFIASDEAHREAIAITRPRSS